MKNLIKKILFIGVILILGGVNAGYGQNVNFMQNQNQGLIQIANQSQLADTLNLWGDVRVSGKYLVPRGTDLTDLISYARGPAGLSGKGASEITVFVSRYSKASNQYKSKSFKMKLNEPLPPEMKNYTLHNGDVITVKAKKKTTFRDYFTIIAPIISLGLTAYLTTYRLTH
ncbi:MAG TPA: hypothetical protein VE868_00770 [Balneolaceae bacterium]|nr:hypothetical protein [Balneolaceae bacterium]